MSAVTPTHWQRWLRYVLRHKGYLALAFAMVAAAMAAELAMPKAFGFLIDRMLDGEAVARGSIVLPGLGPVALGRGFLVLLGLLLGLLAVRSVAGYVRSYALARVGEEVHLDLRRDLFAHLQRLPLSYFDTQYTGRIMARITTDADALWHLVHDGVLHVLAPVITILVVLILLFRLHVGLTLLSLLCVPVIAVTYLRTRRRAMTIGEAQREALAALYTRLQERISGIRLVRIFGRGEAEVQSFAHELRELYRRNLALVSTYAALGAKSQFMTGATAAVILCLGGVAASRGRLTVGELVQFYLYVGLLLSPLDLLARASVRVLTDAEVAMGRIFELLDTPQAQELDGIKRPCPRLSGAVCFDRVTFAYQENRPVISDVSFRLPAGRVVALVGPSGVGKTTVVNLLCRFYHPTSGKILVDGHDVDAVEVDGYRAQISYVTQDHFLFSGTVMENIRYARPEATDEEVQRAAMRANAHDFIMRFTHGYETRVGERGATLSGGQQQRINIARALLRDPAILILDEPTSALDAESEMILLDALKTVFRGRTCFIIAHRLSTVMQADEILVFQEGRIVQRGDHRTLVAQPGLYRELCRKQLTGLGGSPVDVPRGDADGDAGDPVWGGRDGDT